MGKFILKLLPPGTPKRVELPPLSNFHPAYAMDSRNLKAYLLVLFDTLPIELDNKILELAYKPMGWRLGRGLFVGPDGAYLHIRKLSREWNLAIYQYSGDELQRFRDETLKALRDFDEKQRTKRLSSPAKPKAPTGSAWLKGKHKKAMLFLDCACVLRNTGRPDLDSLIDNVVEELEVDPAIVALVKTYLAGPDDSGEAYKNSRISDEYHKVCADIAALVKPVPVKKKTVAQKAAAKKAAAKKIITPLPACGYHKTTGKLRQS